MSLQKFRKLTAVGFCSALAACGGGGGNDGSTSAPQSQVANSTGNSNVGSGGTSTPTSSTSFPSGNASSAPGSGDGATPSSGGGNTAGDAGPTPPASAFSAQLVSAPPEIQPAIVSAPMEFVVSGTNLGNVELVSAKDETILYGRFTISADKTRATLPWNHQNRYNDTTYDTYQFRILAWDVPPGESGTKTEVMAPRTYRGMYNPGCHTCGGEAP